MFETPYMRKILNFLEKIWSGHEGDFLWEPTRAESEINKKLSEELRRCKNAEYSNIYYVCGPADEWISTYKF